MSRFPRIFILSGLVFALLAFLLGGLLFGWGNLLASLEAALLIGLIAGLTLAALAELIIRLMRFGGCATALLAGVFAVVGLILGLSAFFAMLYVPKGAWQKLPDPPEKLAQLTGAGSYNLTRQAIYSRSGTGKLYKLVCSGSASCTWSQLPGKPDLAEAVIPNEVCPAGQGSRYPTPPLPGKATASQQVNVCGAEYSIQYNYVLLEDGSVWVWKRSSSIYEPIAGLPLGGIAGLMAGLVCSLPLFLKANRDWWKLDGG